MSQRQTSSDPSSFSLPPEDRARMLAAMAGAIDGGFWTSPDGNSGGSPGEIAAAMLCALEPLLAEREAAAREEGAEDALARWQQAGLALNASRAEARGLREALEGLRDLRAISFISTQHALDSYVDAVQRRVDAALSASPDTETRGAGLLDIADEVKEVATSLTHVPGLEPEVLDDHVTDLLVIAGRLREPSRPVSVPEQEEGRHEWAGPWWQVRMAAGMAWAWTDDDALSLAAEAAGGEVRAFVPASSVPASLRERLTSDETAEGLARARGERDLARWRDEGVAYDCSGWESFTPEARSRRIAEAKSDLAAVADYLDNRTEGA